eukprot:CAMPEP_0174955170 /NCGR_PEP_ID=MMETSP0004_2-20121128/835_1 /TAXON_ID=420556 /ORGANISM="Ochromonas sp., Strain CCMP1393" /LENGTH=153 /DNA_ID=CAMNT_0016203073 /DNA_START=116 /DNA_END=577 /DNA_ORIENTATION=+
MTGTFRKGLLGVFHSPHFHFSTNASSLGSLDNSLIITNSCAKRIKLLQEQSKNPNLHLRISVEGGGCSGFQYTFEMEDAEELDDEDDGIYSKHGAKVVVDHGSFELIKGSTVDYVQEMIRSSFAISHNPQSESACGCGSSFAVKNFSVNPALD